MPNYLGVDWGGTYIKAGIVNARGQILKKLTYSSEKLKKSQSFIDYLEHLLDNFRKFKIKGVGIGAPGIIDIQKGFIYYLPNIAGWENYPLRAVLQKKIKLPVSIDNDANVFALAEARLGVAKTARCAIFLTLGTGLGGAVIWNGKILKTRTSAAELGHVPIELFGKRCNCQGQGCIETFVGANYLIKRYEELKKNGSCVKEVKELFKKAMLQEPEALVVWEEFSNALGMFLAGMVNIFNPQLIVLGGGVAGAFSLFKNSLLRTIKKQAMWPNCKGLKLVKARLKNAGVIGAAILAKESGNSKL